MFTVASLDEGTAGLGTAEAIVSLFPQLSPQLLKRMVYYSHKKIEELLDMNALDSQEGEEATPVFHEGR